MNLVAEKSRLQIATDALASELADIEERLAAIEIEACQLENRRMRLRAAIESIRLSTGNDGTVAATGPMTTASPPVKPSPAARALLEKLRSDISKTWKVEELQRHLQSSTSGVSDKYASNTLRKLHDRGLLLKIGRGMYRANNMLLAIEGLDESDLE